MDSIFTSPKRINGYVISSDTPSSNGSTLEAAPYPCLIGQSTPNLNGTSPITPNGVLSGDELDKERLKRGRPRAESISSMIVEGSKADSNHKCKICHRNFPREKSLQAHMRTHTGQLNFKSI